MLCHDAMIDVMSNVIINAGWWYNTTGKIDSIIQKGVPYGIGKITTTTKCIPRPRVMPALGVVVVLHSRSIATCAAATSLVPPNPRCPCGSCRRKKTNNNNNKKIRYDTIDSNNNNSKRDATIEINNSNNINNTYYLCVSLLFETNRMCTHISFVLLPLYLPQ